MENQDNVSTDSEEHIHSKNNFKILFILGSVFLIITIIFMCLHFYWRNVVGDADLGKNGYYGYWLAQSQYEDNIISRLEFKEIEKEFNNIKAICSFFKYASFSFGGITIIILITGIVLKIKEKGGIEIVN